MKLTTTKTLLLLAVTLFTVFAYTFLHESGHALVGVLAGGKVTAFSINFFQLSAHVGMDASLTSAQTFANNLAGAGLPLLVWLVFMLVTPRNTNFVLESLKLSGSLVFLSTLLAWIVLPLLEILEKAPASDDVINFMRNSGIPPLWVTLAALILFIGGVRLAANRLTGLRTTLNAPLDLASTPIRVSLFTLLGISLLFGLTAFTLNGFRFSTFSATSIRPPAGSQLIETVDLAQAHTQSVLCDFTLVESSSIGIYLIVENINTNYVDIRLSSTTGYGQVILHGEGYSAAVDYPRLEATLQPGRYTCLLTNQPSLGTVSLYITGLP